MGLYILKSKCNHTLTFQVAIQSLLEAHGMFCVIFLQRGHLDEREREEREKKRCNKSFANRSSKFIKGLKR